MRQNFHFTRRGETYFKLRMEISTHGVNKPWRMPKITIKNRKARSFSVQNKSSSRWFPSLDMATCSRRLKMNAALSHASSSRIRRARSIVLPPKHLNRVLYVIFLFLNLLQLGKQYHFRNFCGMSHLGPTNDLTPADKVTNKLLTVTKLKREAKLHVKNQNERYFALLALQRLSPFKREKHLNGVALHRVCYM